MELDVNLPMSAVANDALLEWYGLEDLEPAKVMTLTIGEFCRRQFIDVSDFLINVAWMKKLSEREMESFDVHASYSSYEV